MSKISNISNLNEIDESTDNIFIEYKFRSDELIYLYDNLNVFMVVSKQFGRQDEVQAFNNIIGCIKKTYVINHKENIDEDNLFPINIHIYELAYLIPIIIESYQAYLNVKSDDKMVCKIYDILTRILPDYIEYKNSTIKRFLELPYLIKEEVLRNINKQRL